MNHNLENILEEAWNELEERTVSTPASISVIRKAYKQIMQKINSLLPSMTISPEEELNQSMTGITEIIQKMTVFNYAADNFISNASQESDYTKFVKEISDMQNTYNVRMIEVFQKNMRACNSLQEQLEKNTSRDNSKSSSSQQPQINELLPRIILFQSGDEQFDALHNSKHQIPINTMPSGNARFDDENQEYLEELRRVASKF